MLDMPRPSIASGNVEGASAVRSCISNPGCKGMDASHPFLRRLCSIGHCPAARSARRRRPARTVRRLPLPRPRRLRDADCSDGEAAVRIAEADRPDLIILDIMMPASTASRPAVGSGHAATRRPGPDVSARPRRRRRLASPARTACSQAVQPACAAEAVKPSSRREPPRRRLERQPILQNASA